MSESVTAGGGGGTQGKEATRGVEARTVAHPPSHPGGARAYHSTKRCEYDRESTPQPRGIDTGHEASVPGRQQPAVNQQVVGVWPIIA